MTGTRRAPRDAARLLEAAEAYRPDFAMPLWLLLVTRTRGELCAIRWSDIDLAEQDLLIERAYATRGGRKVIKPAKTHQRRRLALDPATVELLAGYRELGGKRAEEGRRNRRGRRLRLLQRRVR
jgi:integrase